jgi:flagellar basal-body rod modification protein FlgD
MTPSITSATGSDAFSQLNGGASAAASDAAADRFLKLLVAQMQNQDPLAPMDNAQVTSQMAQINTVAGIDKLNGTIGTLASRLLQMQTLQGAALVGRDVLVEGSSLALGDDGKAAAAFELVGAADSVKIEILSPSGRVIDTLDLGAESAGRHRFEWDAAGKDGSANAFRVVAKSGANAVGVTPLVADRVLAVSTEGDTLRLELARLGSVDYSAVRATS